MASMTFTVPAFTQDMAEARVLDLQISANIEHAGRVEHDVTLNSLLVAEAHVYHQPERTHRIATALRVLANDLDALATAWKPEPAEPGDA